MVQHQYHSQYFHTLLKTHHSVTQDTIVKLLICWQVAYWWTSVSTLWKEMIKKKTSAIGFWASDSSWRTGNDASTVAGHSESLLPDSINTCTSSNEMHHQQALSPIPPDMFFCLSCWLESFCLWTGTIFIGTENSILQFQSSWTELRDDTKYETGSNGKTQQPWCWLAQQNLKERRKTKETKGLGF